MRPAEPGTVQSSPVAESDAGADARRAGTLCPSTTCHDGAVVIGVLGEDGRLGYFRPSLPVDEQFVRASSAHGDPETRFRFADRCVQDSCEHWSGARCSLIGRLTRAARDTGLAQGEGLPRCAIRHDCRWFAQEGSQACATCPVVAYRPARNGS